VQAFENKFSFIGEYDIFNCPTKKEKFFHLFAELQIQMSRFCIINKMMFLKIYTFTSEA
jgi:hypothetical protein